MYFDIDVNSLGLKRSEPKMRNNKRKKEISGNKVEEKFDGVNERKK